MDIFEKSDLQKIQDGINTTIRGSQAEDTAQNEQTEKDDDFNEKLSGITEPFAQELLRKPVEKLGEKAFGKLARGVRSRIGKGLNRLRGNVQQRVGDAVNELAERAGVNPDSISGAAQALASGGDPLQALPSGSDLATAASRAATPLNSGLPDDAITALNRVRASSGQQPLTNPTDEAQEVDAFSGQPITNRIDEPAPATQPDNSVSADFDNTPIVRAADAPSDAPAALPDTPAPPSLATGRSTATQSLEDFLPLNKASDVSSPPSLQTSARVVQPRAVGDTPLATGDQDQLAPMRSLIKSTNSAEQNSDILRRFRATAQDDPATLLTPGRTGPPAPPAPAPDAPAAGTGGSDPAPPAPTPAPDTPAQHTPVPSEDGPSASTVTAEVGEDDILPDAGKAFLTGEAALGGPEDPLADIVGALAGLGTLLGGVFGQHHTKVPTATALPTVGTAQKGVY